MSFGKLSQYWQYNSINRMQYSVYTGGAVASSVTTKENDSIGPPDAGLRTMWSVNHGAEVRGIATDPSGNVYTGGNTASGVFTTRKYNSSGSLQWSVNHNATVNCIAVDQSGNVYTGGVRITTPSNISYRKYNSSGAVLFSSDAGLGSVNGIAVDKTHFYTAGSMTGAQLQKKTQANASVWARNTGNTAYCVAVDSSGNVYVGHDINSSITTRKYDSAGTLLWSVNHGARVNAIAVDLLGNVYTGGNVSSSITTRKYDSAGNLLWSVNHGGQVFSIAVDIYGYVYTGGFRSSPTGFTTTRKYAPNGELVWSVDSLGPGASNLNCISLSTNITTMPQFF